MSKEAIMTDGAPAAIGPYSQGIMAGGLIFVSGQLPLDPKTGEAAGVDIEAQTHRSLKNVEAVLEAAGLSMDDVVKTTVFLKDLNDFTAMNGVYASCFSAPFPARAVVEAVRLPKDVLVEIEAIALKK